MFICRRRLDLALSYHRSAHHLHSRARSFHANSVVHNAAPSPLETRLRQGLKDAMKAKDRPASTCFKAILAEVTYASKSSSSPTEGLSESGVIQTLRKGITNRIEAAESYSPSSSSPHPKMHQNLQSEITLLQSFLPPSPSSESLSGLINEVIVGLSDEVRSSKGAMGSVMKGLWEKLGDSAQAVDRKEIGKMVGEMLKGKT
ncbi:MAG: hypothetical protein TREMPRED_001779 [Tremellales sp. Tagirdzhanova-0007]|nr:MAG: hypothetical protein TREMPRED_001779 [Tremellales sp. Tagirdzhanova-0007]